MNCQNHQEKRNLKIKDLSQYRKNKTNVIINTKKCLFKEYIEKSIVYMASESPNGLISIIRIRKNNKYHLDVIKKKL